MATEKDNNPQFPPQEPVGEERLRQLRVLLGQEPPIYEEGGNCTIDIVQRGGGDAGLAL